MREATGQQKLFIDFYLAGRKSNATQAAKDAGYSHKSAHTQASQLLKNPAVARYLESKERELTEQLQNEFIFDAIQARKVMYQILKNEDSRDIDRINVAKDFLDRAGFKPTDKVETKIVGELEIDEKAKLFSRYLGGLEEK